MLKQLLPVIEPEYFPLFFLSIRQMLSGIFARVRKIPPEFLTSIVPDGSERHQDILDPLLTEELRY
jgi:hypothetical protein